MERTHGTTRRRMLQISGMLGATALLAGCSAGAGEQTAKQEQKTDQPAPAPTPTEFAIYDPSGSVEVTQMFSPRLDTLEGKTIAFVSDDAWEDARTFEVIKAQIEEKYPSVTIVTQDNFIHGIEAITRANSGLGEAMVEKGVDAVIVGNAG